jgi:hypothetical protein
MFIFQFGSTAIQRLFLAYCSPLHADFLQKIILKHNLVQLNNENKYILF